MTLMLEDPSSRVRSGERATVDIPRTAYGSHSKSAVRCIAGGCRDGPRFCRPSACAARASRSTHEIVADLRPPAFTPPKVVSHQFATPFHYQYTKEHMQRSHGDGSAALTRLSISHRVSSLPHDKPYSELAFSRALTPTQT